MQEFLQIALSFPTVIFSGLLICVMLYWLMVIVGAADIDLLDVDFDFESDLFPDVDFDADVEVDAEVGNGGILRALMAAIGLGRVPVTIIGSIATLIAWLLCFAAIYYLGPVIGTGVFVGIGVVIASFLLSLPVTSIFTHPLKGVFEIHTRTGGHSLVGKLCKVTSGRVDEEFGRASVDDGGAGLLVSIRCESKGALGRGSKALIIDYQEEGDVYFVEPYDNLLADDDDEVVFDTADAVDEVVQPKTELETNE